MTKERATFLKTVGIFTISPGFSGIIFFIFGLHQDILASKNSPNILFDYIFGSIIFGFFGGILHYSAPAFLLGLIYATLKLKKNLKSYIFIILFSPSFLLVFDYLLDYIFTTKRDIPFSAKVEKTSLILIMCPLSSLASFIAASLSLTKEEKISQICSEE